MAEVNSKVVTVLVLLALSCCTQCSQSNGSRANNTSADDNTQKVADEYTNEMFDEHTEGALLVLQDRLENKYKAMFSEINEKWIKLEREVEDIKEENARLKKGLSRLSDLEDEIERLKHSNMLLVSSETYPTVFNIPYQGVNEVLTKEERKLKTKISYSRQRVKSNKPQSVNEMFKTRLMKEQTNRMVESNKDLMLQQHHGNAIPISNVDLDKVPLLHKRTATHPPIPHKIAFSARLNHTIKFVGQGNIIRFDGIITNLGNNYNKVTGIFTCQVPGTYAFYHNLEISGHHYFFSQLTKNGETEGYDVASGGNSNDVGSGFTILQLQQGDLVWIQAGMVNPDSTIEPAGSSFSGFLLFE